jgi:hypothetical protein
MEAWRAQPTVQTLTHADVSGCVNGWPHDAVIEVRPCTRCGAAIARRGSLAS